MKELSIEEKAQRYDEALERAKKWYNAPNIDKMPTYGNRIIEEIFPELAESEDERIRKEIIKFIDGDYTQRWITDETKASWVAWLEKQGKHSIYNVPSRKVILAILNLGNEWKELTNGCTSKEYGTQFDYIQKHWHKKQGKQKPADKVEPKFHVGDIISNGISEVKIVSIDKNNYTVTNGEIENDAHVGNWVVYFKDQDNWKLKDQKSAWSEADESYYNSALWHIKNSCWEEGIVYNWLKSLKERVQPKQEWSEEDENNILFLTSIIEECFKNREKITLCGDTVCANFTKEDIIDRLKSLKNRVQPQSQSQFAWSEEDEAMYQGVIETEQYMLDVVYGRRIFDVGNEGIKEDCAKELAWLNSRFKKLLEQLK